MECPKCAGALKTDQYQGVEYEQCTSCRGLWFDALEAEELLDAKDPAQIDTGDVKEGKKLNRTRAIMCPKCNVGMAAVHDIEQPHIQLESCPKCHGVFFDAGEFKDFVHEDETFWNRIKSKFAAT